MQKSSIPLRMAVIFASSAGGAYTRQVPDASQIGIQDGAASFVTGFPPVNFLPLDAGGVPPFGQDVNGLYEQITAWTQWLAAGGPVPYDATFSAAIGGYPQGAILADVSVDGYFWFSLVDNNTTDPDAGGTNWVAFSPIGGATTGDIQLTLKTSAPSGWLLCNDGTIGDASSGANFASATAQALFILLYNNVTDTYAPLLTSAGGGTTRAAQGTAAAAWAAHCRMSLTKVLGRALGAAGSGSGLTTRALGQTFGEETHLLITAEIPAHTHPLSPTPVRFTGGSGVAAGVGSTSVNVTDTASAGGGGTHNNMQPTSFLNAMVKL